MNAKQFALANPLILIGGAIALYVVVRGPGQVGKDIGGLFGKLAGGTVDGAAGAVGTVAGSLITAPVTAAKAAAKTVTNTMNNPATNPLYGFGSWLGGATYDLFHPSRPLQPMNIPKTRTHPNLLGMKK